MSTPIVSILINNYNYGQFLSDAIASALKQTYPRTEVIVVDDGSTDNSRQIIAAYGDQIQPILQENSGQSTAFNAGFAASQGDILCLLDADDLFLTEKVTRVVEVFTHYLDVDWCFHSLLVKNFETQEVTPNLYCGQSGRYDLTASLRRGKLAGTMPFEGTACSGLCFRRSLLDRILHAPVGIRINSDDYVKYAAMGLSPGYILLEELAIQRIHTNNAYTQRYDRQALQAKIDLQIAEWLRINFPELTQFANNLFAAGLSLIWQTQQPDKTTQKRIRQYLATTSIGKKLEIYLRAIYYRMKP